MSLDDAVGCNVGEEMRTFDVVPVCDLLDCKLLSMSVTHVIAVEKIVDRFVSLQGMRR